MKQTYIIIILIGVLLISGCANKSSSNLCFVSMQGYLFSVLNNGITTYYLIDPYNYGGLNFSKILNQNEMEDWMEKATGKRDITLSVCTPDISESEATKLVNDYIKGSPYQSFPGVKNIEFQFLIYGIADKESCTYSFIGKTEDKAYNFCTFYVNANGKISDKNIVRSGGCQSSTTSFATKDEATQIMMNYIKNNNILGELSANVPFISYSYPCGNNKR